MPKRGGRHFVLLSGAEQAMSAFKMEIARDLGFGDRLKTMDDWKKLTTQEVGSVGGEMVKRIMVAGEMAILERHKAGVKLSPDIPSDTIVNQADPWRKIIDTKNESQLTN